MEIDHSFKIGTKTFPMIFNTRSLQTIRRRYGGIAALYQRLGIIEGPEGKREADEAEALELLMELATILINDAIAVKNYLNGEKEAPIDFDYIPMFSNPKQIMRQTGIILETIAAGMDFGQKEEDEEIDEVLEEVVTEKNVTGAAGA